jgi:fibronectin-binding autotransporter adhesin
VAPGTIRALSSCADASDRRTRSGSRALPAILALTTAAAFCAVSTKAAATNSRWIAGNGNWNTMANWNPAHVPIAPGDSANCADGSGTYTITLDATPSISFFCQSNPSATVNLNGRTLTVLDPGGLSNAGVVRTNASSTISGPVFNLATGQIIVNQGQTLNLAGPTLRNDGLLQINHTGIYDAWLQVPNDLTVSGAGSIYFNGDNSGDYIYSSGTATLTQEAGHTIHGCGAVRIALVNHGLVSADRSSKSLALSHNPKTNDGIIQATGGGTLEIDGITITNHGGTILADGGNVNVSGTANLVGGTLQSTAGYQFNGTETAILTDVTLAAGSRWVVNQAHETRLSGASFVNHGTVWVNHLGSFDAWLQVLSDLELSGSGDIYLNGDNDGDYIYSGVNATLTQEAGHTIHGCGSIRLPLVNHGTVSADKSGKSLSLSQNPKTNDALMLATAGGALEVNAITVANAGGTILADGGDVRLTGSANVVGGILRSISPSEIVATGTCILTDGSIASGTRLTVNQTQEMRLAGAQLVNDGTVWVNHTGIYDAWIQVLNDMTLSGGGNIYLNGDSDGDYIYSGTGATLTQAAGHTIHGCGSIRLPFVNHGIVAADKDTKALNLSTNPKTNDALIEATAGGTLVITGITVANNGGTILADGGNVQVTGSANLVGGTLRSAPGFQFTSTGTAILTDATLTEDSRWVVNQSQETRLAGASFVNDGTVWVNHTGAYDASLQVLNNLAISGGGDIYLNCNNDTNRIYSGTGASLTQGEGHTIHGSGTIQLPFVNRGVVSGDISGRSLIVTVGSFDNQGIAQATGEGTFKMNTTPVNYASRTLTGGSWRVFDNSTMRMIGAYVDTCRADILLDGPNSRFYRDTGTANALAGLAVIREEGSFSITGGRSFTSAGSLTNSGRVTIGAGSQLTSTGAYTQLTGATRVDGTLNAPGTVDIQLGSLSGCGRINQNVHANGAVLPGGSIDTLTINGNYTQDVAGSLHIELGGTLPGEGDLLSVTGQATLSGQLWVTTADGIDLEDGDSFVILQAAGVSGRFLSPFVGQCPEPGICFEIAYNPTSVVITAHRVASSAVGDEPIRTTAAPVDFALRVRTVAGGAVVTLDLPRAARVRIDLFDPAGRLVACLFEGEPTAGTHDYRWELDRAAGCAGSGILFVRARIVDGGRTLMKTARLLTVR